MRMGKEMRISSTFEGEGWLASEDGELELPCDGRKGGVRQFEKPDTRRKLCGGFSQPISLKTPAGDSERNGDVTPQS